MVTDYLFDQYQQVRRITEEICSPLEVDDFQIQSTEETSPPKWHLAHVTWFFETFLLKKHLNGYRVFNPDYHFIFNSYYQSLGSFHARNRRGNLSRPTIKEIYEYRHHVDEAMKQLFKGLDPIKDQETISFIELGIHHEQQHQELLLMDIKMNFFMNPLKPAYINDSKTPDDQTAELKWKEFAESNYVIGHDQETFAYDNEKPAHKIFLHSFKLANRLVTNAEYLEFIGAGGYENANLWLSDSWATVQQEGWSHPLYWIREKYIWYEFSLYGLRELNPHDPVSHISYYEADAFARWKEKRLPTEAELEIVLSEQQLSGNFFDHGVLHPQSARNTDQWFGDLWNWTSSPYQPYPGFKPMVGSAGEYNGKFMCNQFVLRAGSCVTSQNHLRPSYRNFFYPNERWQFSGIRLAEDMES